MTFEQATAEPRTEAEAAPFSERLRNATMDRHRHAETRPFIGALMDGELSLGDYTRYLAQYAWVYEALESRHASDDPAFLRDERLARFPSITADLDALGAGDWRRSHPALPATADYTARLRELTTGRMPEYLAHHYTRYLGDLSGGQAIGAMIARHYGASPEQLAFFRFEGIERPVVYKRDYRAALDALELDETQREAAIAEARRAFDHNAAVFDELGAA